MTSAPVRDPLSDHLITPQNAALLLIDYQPAQLAGVRSMDRDLLVKNAVSTVRTIKTFGVPVVHSTINVATGRGQPTLPELTDLLKRRQAARPDHDQLLGGHRIRPGRPRDRPPQAHPLRPVDRNLHGLHRP
jgi:nicotinamidase-related amidase